MIGHGIPSMVSICHLRDGRRWWSRRHVETVRCTRMFGFDRRRAGKVDAKEEPVPPREPTDHRVPRLPNVRTTI